MKNFDDAALYNYDRFRIGQPHVQDGGVWRLPNNAYLIHCPDLSRERTLDGTGLVEWFRGHKIIGLNIQLSETIPADGVRLRDRSPAEVVLQVGRPRTFDEVYYELNFELTSNFPEYQLEEAPPLVVYFVTERALTPEEQTSFESVRDKLGFYFSLEHKVAPHKPRVPVEPSKGGMGLRLTPLRELKGLSTRVSRKYEEDQDLWKSERVGLLTGTDVEKNYLPTEWDEGYRGLVQSSAFEPQNIRNYLSLNDSVIYEMPLQEKLDGFYRASGVTGSELLELYRLGRVKFILKQGVDRYQLGLLEQLIEIHPDSVLFPRRLACQNIAEVKRRVPLLLPPFGMAERKVFLSSLIAAKRQIQDPKMSAYLDLMINEFSRIWGQIDYRVLREGPMSGAAIGLGFVAAGLYKSIKGQDLGVEFMATAPAVETAFALKANLFPVQTETYTDEGQARILMSLYDGIPRTIPSWTDRTRLVTDELLAIGDHVPVVEFAKELRKGDLARFRRLVYDLARSGASEEELREAVQRLNKEIRAYERNEGLLNQIDLFGLLKEVKTVPFLGWLLKLPVMEKLKTDHAGIGAVLDTLEGMTTLDPPHRPFLARIRRNLRNAI